MFIALQKKVKFIGSFLVAFMWLAHAAVAQFEGVIAMKMKVQSLPEEWESMREQMETTSIFYVAPNASRIQSFINQANESILITNQVERTKYMCVIWDKEKLAIQSSWDNKTQQNHSGIFTPTGETKIIRDFLCLKGTYTRALDGQSMDVEVWYTPDIPMIGGEMPEVPGFIMEMKLNDQGVELLLEVESLEKKKIDSNLFQVPEGYKIISEQEFNQVYLKH